MIVILRVCLEKLFREKVNSINKNTPRATPENKIIPQNVILISKRILRRYIKKLPKSVY